ncbi:MAG: hypothetical protein HOC74_33670 [Gemmatimonadetes bacterium]|jgi:hypothetical protein|nr:hypothetical protein [Gemmatimonadota bacterium]
MTPRERVERTLRGELANKVPFTAFADRLPRSAASRRLRNGGLCLIDRQASIFRVVTPNVHRQQIHYVEGGNTFVRTALETPAGTLDEVEQYGPNGMTSWHVERFFKDPEDYKPLLALIEDQQYEPDYENFLQRQEQLGDDFFLRPDIGYSPMHTIVYSLMGIECFAREWAERRDEVIELYDALVENHRSLYPIAAQSPALMVNYCGNVSPEIVGLKRFEEYYLPHYDEFADIMHAHDKLVSVHFDAATWLFEEFIGLSRIDCVEGFTPPPDGDMTVAQARSVWHDKLLWIHFPPTAHLDPVAEIEDATRQLLREAASGMRFLIGTAESLPEQNWQEALFAIMKIINTEGQLPLT